MDRLNEEMVESDIICRNPDAIQHLIDNYGKGFSKFLNEVIKFHERENNQESENTRNVAKVYGTLRISLHNHHRMPLKSYFESTGTELSQWINGLDEKRSIAAQAALEELKRHRTQYTTKCKSLKEQWKAMKARCLEAREAHKAAKSNYQRLGREFEKVMQACGEESTNSFGSSDVLDSITDGMDGVRTGSTVTPVFTKRERHRNQLEIKFNEAENDYKEAVQQLRRRIKERTQYHVELLTILKQAAVDADNALLKTEEKLLSLAREHAESVISRVDQRLSQIKEYKPGACYSEWTVDKLSSPAPALEDEANVVFIPFSCMSPSYRDSSTTFPTSPPVVPRLHDERCDSPAAIDSLNNRRSADLHLDTKRRDSVDGSSDGSTPGSTRKIMNFRSSEEIGQKTPELTPTEEEIRGKITTQARTSWFQKTILRWANTGGGRTSSLGGGSGSSPPPSCSSPSVDEEMRAIRQIVQKCVKALEKTGLTTEGLYRKGGSEAKTRYIINDMFENPDGVSLDELHPLVICAVIKKCFIKMRDPLFTEALHSEFVRIGMNPDAEDALADLKKVVCSLPQLNFEIASTFMHHLLRVAEVEENQMSSDSLGKCLAPTLLHQKNVMNMPQSMKHSKEILANLEVKECNRVLTMIIDNVDFLFGKCEDDESSKSSDSVKAVWGPISTAVASEVNEEQIEKCIETTMVERMEATSTFTQHNALCHVESSPISTFQSPQSLGQGSVSSPSAGISKSSVTDSIWSSGSSSGVGQCSWASGSQATRSEDSPPPVPPALGRRKHSTEKNPTRKMHGSSFLNLLRRLRSLDDSVDLDKSFSHGYYPTHNGLRSPLLPSPPPRPASVVHVQDNHDESAAPDDNEKQLSTTLPRPVKTEGRVFVQNGRTRRRGSVGDLNGVYRGLGPPPVPPPKPPHLRLSPSTDSSTSTSRKSSHETECSSSGQKSPVRMKFILVRRQSEPGVLGGFRDFSEEDIEARRQRRASTVPGAPYEALTNNRMFVPRRSQPEFV